MFILGTVISGYKVRDGVWTLIGKGDPQRPQVNNPTVHTNIENNYAAKLLMNLFVDKVFSYHFYDICRHFTQ